jgi:hypothetical protein
MVEYWGDVRGKQKPKPNPFLYPNGDQTTRVQTAANAVYMPFGSAVKHQLQGNLDDEESYYNKEISFINDKLNELTERLEEEEAKKGLMGKFGETLLSCAGCASRRASATSDTLQQIKYYTKELEKLQQLEASDRKQMSDDLSKIRYGEGGGTKNIKKRSKKYRKSNKKTQRRRVRKNKTRRTRI